MSLPLASAAFKDLVVVLAATGLVIPAFAALRISPVVGFILVGIVVGPQGLGGIPALDAFSISHAEALAPAAEIGIAMLLFALGLELSIDRLRTMRRLLLSLGPVQWLGSAALLGLLLAPFGLGLVTTIVLALALALSSTAVGLQMLANSGRLGTTVGRSAIAIFLFQDMALAPLLLGLGVVSGEAPLRALGLGLLAIVGIVAAGRLFLKPLFLQAARTRRPELFLAAALVVLIGSAAATASVGLSPAIGAMIAGIMLAETEYRRQVEAAIAPFQGLLLGVFLIWVGMGLDLAGIAARPGLVLGGVAAVCLAKALVIGVALRVSGREAGVALHVAALTAAPSETTLIVLGAAAVSGLLAPPIASLAILVTGLGLALAPLLGFAGQTLERRVGARLPALADGSAFDAGPGRIVIIGYGRVGRMVASILDAHDRAYLAIDSDPDAVARLRRAGKPVIYGDARRPELLAGLGLDKAGAVVLTLDATPALDTLVRLIRDRHPDLCIVVRARDADHARRLYKLGATDAVPETVESSLQLAEALLIDLGVPMGLVIASIHERRAELRATIQDGAPPTKRITLRSRRR